MFLQKNTIAKEGIVVKMAVGIALMGLRKWIRERHKKVVYSI